MDGAKIGPVQMIWNGKGDEMAEAIVRSRVFKNSYRDSVELMRVAAEIEQLPGVSRAGLVMGTPANMAILADAGLLSGSAESAGLNDLIVAVCTRDEETAADALERAARLLASQPDAEIDTDAARESLHTIAAAAAELGAPNLALISTPGTYATAEALKALKRGMNVFLFSDNVPLEDEIELKKLARKKGLLMMGPDCGTAILDGVPLGFANVVRRGHIGLIGASGTGLQQVSCLIDRLGEGVSQAIGVGGRDLDERVGGTMMRFALDRLSRDPGTEVIVLLSKPPAPSVAQQVLDASRSASKPVVVNFLGGDTEVARAAGAVAAVTLEEAATQAVSILRGGSATALSPEHADTGHLESLREQLSDLARGQDCIRGLYSGGTLAYEAKLVLRAVLGREEASKQEILDLGDDEYTVGRPHPMIDPRLRSEQIVAAAREASVAVVLLDVVLGYAANPDPAGALVPAIAQARQTARSDGRSLVFVASVCGTEADPQNLGAQEAILRAAGVLLAPSNARAAHLAAEIVEAARSQAGVGQGGQERPSWSR